MAFVCRGCQCGNKGESFVSLNCSHLPLPLLTPWTRVVLTSDRVKTPGLLSLILYVHMIEHIKSTTPRPQSTLQYTIGFH